jgi:septum formation protein
VAIRSPWHPALPGRPHAIPIQPRLTDPLIPEPANGRPLLVLASASPRRRELLAEAGYAVELDPSGIDEPEPSPGSDPAEYVAMLAWKKAAAVAARRGAGLILAADTACAVGGQILGKPVDRDDAERMIRLQEGRDSDVLTGACLYRAERGEWVGAVETSVVRFRMLDDAERTAYLDTNRWEGKAGAYGIQDGDPFVSIVRGSYSNVVGLPMERLAALLREYPALTR